MAVKSGGSKRGGAKNDVANSIALDAEGNAYLTGGAYGPATFDGITLSGNNGINFSNKVMIVAKYNSSGSVLWAKEVKGATRATV